MILQPLYSYKQTLHSPVLIISLLQFLFTIFFPMHGELEPFVPKNHESLAEIHAFAVWDEVEAFRNHRSLQETVVAVLDSGVDADHEDLQGRLYEGNSWILDEDGLPDRTDPTGHGTFVSGEIAANAENDLGIAGIAGKLPVKILPLKILNQNHDAELGDLTEAIRYAVDWRGPDDQKVRIINISLGARIITPPQSLVDAIDYAVDHDVLVVAAAGNEYRAVEGYYPAYFENVLSVGAISKNHRLLPSSNEGADVAVLGENVHSTIPENQYGMNSGTSFAAPLISATAAMLWSTFPDASVEEMKRAIFAGYEEYACDSTAGEERCYRYRMDEALNELIR